MIADWIAPIVAVVCCLVAWAKYRRERRSSWIARRLRG